jgi:hypothetical protein
MDGHEGNTHSDIYRVYYDYYICTVHSKNSPLTRAGVIMGETQLSMYALYRESWAPGPRPVPDSATRKVYHRSTPIMIFPGGSGG